MDRNRTPRRLVRTVVGVLALAMFVAACDGGDSGSDAASDPEASAASASTRGPTPSGSCPEGSRPVPGIAYENVPGVAPDLVSLDVYPPDHGCPAPVVIWVHGGGWSIGDKRNQMPDKVELFNDAGYVVVSVNYRLTDPASPDPVRYPTHDEDVAAAVAWVHDHIAGYGGDPARLALLGHSAGAQIVASVATDARFLGAHGLGLDALRCAAPLDTEGYDVSGPAGAGIGIYRNAFGDDPATWADASPQSHVAPGKGIPPFLLVERGTLARRRAAETFAQHLRDAGVAVTMVEARGLTHAQVNSQIGAPGDTVITPPLSTFLADCLVPKS
jgi:arylformamidase